MIADAAVRAARRSVEMTWGAPLHPHLDALHVHVLVQRSTELVILVLIFVCCKIICEITEITQKITKKIFPIVSINSLWLQTHWQHTSIHKGCHGEVGQHKKKEDGTAWRHSRADGHSQPRASEYTNTGEEKTVYCTCHRVLIQSRSHVVNQGFDSVSEPGKYPSLRGLG